MIERVVATNADSRGERVGNEGEDVEAAAALVRVGDGLEADSGRSQDQVVRSGGDLDGDGVGRGDVVLGVVTPDLEVPPFDEAALGESLDHSAYALVEDRLRRVLEDRNSAERL